MSRGWDHPSPLPNKGKAAGMVRQLPTTGNSKNCGALLKWPCRCSSTGLPNLSMTFIKPEDDINRWLRAVLIDMIERYSDGTTEALQAAITTLTRIVEPAILEEQFAPWIDAYGELLEQHQRTDRVLLNPNTPACQEGLVG